jgi:hypothetical protein
MGITLDPQLVPELQWSYVVCTYDGNEGRIYINCKRLVTFVVPSVDINLPGSEIYIGSGGIKNNFELNFKGYIDDVMIFDRGITDAEAKALYPSAIEESSDILSFKFDEQVKETSIDNADHVVDAEIDCHADITRLVPIFTLEPEAIAKVNGVVQESGVTLNSYAQPVIYTVGNDAECYQTLWQINVKIRHLAIEPDSITNVITQNGDTMNEYLMVPEAYKGSTLTVVNRYGKEVFFSSDYQNDFSGTNLSSGVYYYVLINNCFPHPVRGAVTIQR